MLLLRNLPIRPLIPPATKLIPHGLATTFTTTTTTAAAHAPKMSISTQAEAEIKRNPHPDFKAAEAARPDWDAAVHFNYKKTADPAWKLGQGANRLHDPSPPRHVCIDPYEEGRPAPFNYKLLVSGIVPRPIAFVSTQSAGAGDSGSGTSAPARNLAPMSYFNVINHDPPLFALGLTGSLERPKDTLRNLAETRECVVNIISEGFVEAANATSVDSPYGASEWDVSGLTPVSDCAEVRPPRVGEAVFAVECRVESIREFESRSSPGRKSGCLVVLEGLRFWVREDATNPDRSQVLPEVLRPMSRLGGITYARVTEAMELPRPNFEKDIGGLEGYERLKQKREGEDGGS